jgi:hypothetical protein
VRDRQEYNDLMGEDEKDGAQEPVQAPRPQDSDEHPSKDDDTYLDSFRGGPFPKRKQ